MNKLLLTLLCFSLFISCNQKEAKRTPDYASNENLIKYAKNFNLFKQKEYTEIQILNPEQGSIEKRIICYPKKSQKPNIKGNVMYIETPVKGMICLSSTQIGMLNKINSLPFVKGIDDSKYIYNNYILNQVKKEKIKVVGNIETINPERILATKANILMYSGFGKSLSNESKLNSLNIYPIANYDWKEIDPLGKAEWIKIFGVLTDNEKVSNQYFQKVEKAYLNLKSRAKKLTISKKLLAGSMIGDYWYMPAGKSYLAKLFADAKIDYVAKNTVGVGSYSISLEEAIRNFLNATYWINPGAINKKQLQLFNKRYSIFNAYKSNNMYCYSHNSNFFWENSAIEPQHLLNDLIIITHPNEYKGKLYFYKKLKNE